MTTVFIDDADSELKARDKRYIETGLCPNCGHEDIAQSLADAHREFGTITVPCTCTDCGTSWDEVFNLVGIQVADEI